MARFNFDPDKLIKIVLVCALLFWVANFFVDFTTWDVKVLNDDGFTKIVVASLVILGITLVTRLVTAQAISKKSIFTIALAALALWAVAKYLVPAISTGEIHIFSMIANIP